MPPIRLILCSALLLAACTLRPALDFAPEAAESNKTINVFYSTSRGPDAIDTYGPERAAFASFGRIGVAIPPAHQLGVVEVSSKNLTPEEHFVATDSQNFADAAHFRSELSRALRARPRGEREVVIFIHGFNNNFAEGVFRIAQLHHDFGISGVAVHYAWPSLANPLGYAYDRDSALFARDGLEELIRTVKAAGAETVLLVGHSMGAHLSMEAMRQLAIRSPQDIRRNVDSVILISPDIDVDVFRSQAARIGELPDPFIIFVSERDRALALSARLSGETNRLGNLRDAEQIADLDVTLIDVSRFSKGLALGHFTVGSSPALIRILQQLPGVEAVISGDTAGRTGLLAGTVLTLQNATEIVLSPITELAELAE